MLVVVNWEEQSICLGGCITGFDYLRALLRALVLTFCHFHYVVWDMLCFATAWVQQNTNRNFVRRRMGLTWLVFEISSSMWEESLWFTRLCVCDQRVLKVHTVYLWSQMTASWTRRCGLYTRSKDVQHANMWWRTCLLTLPTKKVLHLVDKETESEQTETQVLMWTHLVHMKTTGFESKLLTICRCYVFLLPDVLASRLNFFQVVKPTADVSKTSIEYCGHVPDLFRCTSFPSKYQKTCPHILGNQPIKTLDSREQDSIWPTIASWNLTNSRLDTREDTKHTPVETQMVAWECWPAISWRVRWSLPIQPQYSDKMFTANNQDSAQL